MPVVVVAVYMSKTLQTPRHRILGFENSFLLRGGPKPAFESSLPTSWTGKFFTDWEARVPPGGHFKVLPQVASGEESLAFPEPPVARAQVGRAITPKPAGGQAFLGLLPCILHRETDLF